MHTRTQTRAGNEKLSNDQRLKLLYSLSRCQTQTSHYFSFQSQCFKDGQLAVLVNIGFIRPTTFLWSNGRIFKDGTPRRS